MNGMFPRRCGGIGAGIVLVSILATHATADSVRLSDPLAPASTNQVASLESFALSVGVNLADAAVNLQAVRGEAPPPGLPERVFCAVHKTFELDSTTRATNSFDPLFSIAQN